MLDSAHLRKNILTTRNALTQQQIETRSAAIHHRLLGLKELHGHQTIFVYVSFRSEVETLSLIDKLLDMGKTVVVPITRLKEKRLDAVQITNRLTDLTPGYCNIPEPLATLCATAAVAPDKIEIILLPGSVFDERGGRFGYGGGYYDRFLAQVPRAIRIGLAFDLQIIEKAPLEDHDELLDLIVTEKRVIAGIQREI